jgi:hypothetical protein
VAKRSDDPSAGALRNRRYRARLARHEALGTFVISEQLISALLCRGQIAEKAASSIREIEDAVARLLRSYSDL